MAVEKIHTGGIVRVRAQMPKNKIWERLWLWLC